MAEFKTIETQEQFDEIIKERLERNTKTVTENVTKQFEGYISPDDLETKTKDLTGQIETLTSEKSTLETQVEELKGKVHKYEIGSVKTKVAHEFKIPYELSHKLSGETEEEIRKDAESLAKFVGTTHQAPNFNPETPPGKSKDEAFKRTLAKLKGE